MTRPAAPTRKLRCCDYDRTLLQTFAQVTRSGTHRPDVAARFGATSPARSYSWYWRFT
jgi:hypothetical protein